MVEEIHLAKGSKRVKFICKWRGKINDVIKNQTEDDMFREYSKKLAGSWIMKLCTGVVLHWQFQKLSKTITAEILSYC